MTLIKLAKRLETLIADNYPLILTGIGVTGTITTAYLTGKATFKAADILRNEQEEFDRKVEDQLGSEFETNELDFKEKVLLVWKFYIPPVVTGVLTVAAIITANRVGSKRAAALAVAYSLSERAFDEYRTKIVEKMGERKEKTAREELAQDRVSKQVGSREIIVTGNGSVLCYEAFTGRYFLSDHETLRKAENDVNHRVIHDSFASLSDFYDLIGLAHTSFSDEVGWNMDKLLDLEISATLTEATNKPCMVVDFKVAPVRHFSRLS